MLGVAGSERLASLRCLGQHSKVWALGQHKQSFSSQGKVKLTVHILSCNQPPGQQIPKPATTPERFIISYLVWQSYNTRNPPCRMHS